jgi:hypothetical protein
MIGTSENSGVYLLAGSGTDENKLAATAAAGNTVVAVNAAGKVTLSGYNALAVPGCDAVVDVTNGAGHS